MKKQYRSRVLASVHETAEALTGTGVMSKQTMREFDELCLTPVRPLTPEEIRELREREGASQAVFAMFLGTSVKTVQAWEQGVTRPPKMACRIFDEIRQNPEYWLERLKALIVSQ